jgi:hypothetical protein
VGSDVGGQVVFTREGFAALGAYKRLLSRVHTEVVGEVAALRKALVALRTASTSFPYAGKQEWDKWKDRVKLALGSCVVEDSLNLLPPYI